MELCQEKPVFWADTKRAVQCVSHKKITKGLKLGFKEVEELISSMQKATFLKAWLYEYP